MKAGSATGMGTAGSNELFQSALARISSYCHVILTHLQNKHLQSYICFLRFVYQEKRNLKEVRIPGIEVIVHKHLSGGFSRDADSVRYCGIKQSEGCSIPKLKLPHK